MKTSTMVICALSLGFTACSSFSKSSEHNLYQVHVGETKSELVAAIGNPDNREIEGSVEHWHYRIYANDNRRIYPYTATFEGDKLTRWDFDTASVRQGEDGDAPAHLRQPTSVGRQF